MAGGSKIKEIYTIGYGDKEFEELLQLLKGNEIEVLVDVRSFPRSKWPKYKKENLKQNLPEKGIEYAHFKGLGGIETGCFEFLYR